MGVRLAKRAVGIQGEMSLGAAIIPSPQKSFKKLISYCEDRFLGLEYFNKKLFKK
jgi:hypothetical protein